VGRGGAKGSEDAKGTFRQRELIQVYARPRIEGWRTLNLGRLTKKAYRQNPNVNVGQRAAVRGRRHRLVARANLPRPPGIDGTCSTGVEGRDEFDLVGGSVGAAGRPGLGGARCRRPATTSCCPSGQRERARQKMSLKCSPPGPLSQRKSVVHGSGPIGLITGGRLRAVR